MSDAHYIHYDMKVDDVTTAEEVEDVKAHVRAALRAAGVPYAPEFALFSSYHAQDIKPTPSAPHRGATGRAVRGSDRGHRRGVEGGGTHALTRG